MTEAFPEIAAKLNRAEPDQRRAIISETMVGHEKTKWFPTSGPQADAYYSLADELLYGGEAGGGKSGLLTGLALCEHQNSLLMRRNYADLGSLIDDILLSHGSRLGFNGSPPAVLSTDDNRRIDFGGAKNPGDEQHWRGRPHDLLGIDETSQFLESQVQFLMGWVRSIDPDQRCRVVFATNPPEEPATGQWLRSWFSPWLDPRHPNPAKPGELRWYVIDANGDLAWVDGPEDLEIDGEPVTPLSRTFIPASLEDNPFLKKTGYKSRLDALPEPLRSAIRDGNWMISHKDDEFQCIPSNWVIAAQSRWTSKHPAHSPMCAIGVDVAQGGDNETVLARRYDAWFDELVAVSGRETPYGSDVAALVIKNRRNRATVIIDVGGGYGGGAIEHLSDNSIVAEKFNGSVSVNSRTADRSLQFFNKRAEAWWRFREALDPDQEGGSPVALPPDSILVADLTAPRFTVTPRGIKIESKDDIVGRLGHSPDRGDAVVMSWAAGPTNATHGKMWRSALAQGQRPKVLRAYDSRKRRSP